jgi:pimeloyl-ACP methyl ester carboxylesterase
MTVPARPMPQDNPFFSYAAKRRAHIAHGQASAELKPLPRPAWLPEDVWPFETRHLTVDGAAIAVTDVGEGPALLFVHTGFWSFIWRDVMTRLAPEFRCITLDAPGTGLSARVPSQAITLQNSSRAIAAVIEALDLRDLALVIHDLGGPAGLAAISRCPDRVRGIAALNTFGWKPSGALFRGLLALMGSGLMREFDALTQFLPRVTSTAFGAARRMDPASRRAFRAGIGRQGLRSFHYYLRSARKSDELYHQIESALTGLLRPLPLLTIFGEYNDPLKFQPQWKALFPAAIQIIVPRGNHFPMCDDPELIANTIRSWHREFVQPRA